MSQAKQWKLKLVTAGAVALLAAVALSQAGCADEGPVSVECESTLDYYSENVEPLIGEKCAGCHRLGGKAAATSYVLAPSAVAGFLEKNLEVVRQLALTEQSGKSLWLLKPTLQIPHEGGQVIQIGDPSYNAMLGLVVRLKNDEVCEPKQSGYFTGVELHGPAGTLRKAAIILAGRLPTDAEYAFVEQNGFPGVEAVLDEMMKEPAFNEWLHMTFNDIFITDLYINGGSGILQCPDPADQDPELPVFECYSDPLWYQTEGQAMIQQYGFTGFEELELYVDTSIAREGTALIQHVVNNDLPFTEVLTADYTMVTPLSMRSFGATLVDGYAFTTNNPLEFQPARVENRPHAGVLTSFAWLSRHPTTPTNRNRARARKLHKWFLATDILSFSKQPVNQSATTADNPTRDDPNCSLCHAVNDPLAGTFQAFNEFGLWTATPQWYPEMWPPGFAGEAMPNTEANAGLQWAVKRVVRDERFPIGAVYNAYRGLIGRNPMVAPDDYADPLFQHKFRGFIAQANTFRHIGDNFRANNFNFKTILKDMVMTPYFRAKNAVALSPEQQALLADVGMARLLPPEMLHRKINAVLGIPWVEQGIRSPNLNYDPRNPGQVGQYQLYYGGIDSDTTTDRVSEPNGVMAAVTDRMAIQMACRAVPDDFAQEAENRKLFPMVQLNGKQEDPMTLAPETPNGIAIPLAQQGVKEAIVHLHDRVLGEKLSVDDAEVEQTYQLFLETWNEGKQGITDMSLGEQLLQECAATAEFYSGMSYPAERQVTNDPNYVVRAWMAVLVYNLGQFEFIFE